MPNRLRKATAIKDKLTKKLKKKLHKDSPLEKLQKIKTHIQAKKLDIDAKIVALETTVDQVTDLVSQDGQEKAAKKAALKAAKQKGYIFDTAKKAAKEFSKAITIISEKDDSEEAATLYHEIQVLYRAIEVHQDSAIGHLEDVHNTLNSELSAEAGAQLTRLEESMPSPAGYHIYQKEFCHVEHLTEKQIIQLRGEHVQLKKISDKEYGVFEIMAKWPKGWFDSPLSFLKNIFKAKVEVHGERTDSRTVTETATDGYISEFKMEQSELVDVIIKFNRILLEAKIKGSISLMVGHQGSVGTFSLKSEAAYEAAVWAKASLKALNASVGASVQASLESTIEFDSKEKEIGGKKLSFDISAVFKAYGKAQAVVAAGAMIMGKTENMGSSDSVIGEYAGASNESLGEKAIEGTMGVTAGAWAGVGVAVELVGAVNCDIKGTRTKLIGIAEEFHIEFGIGGKVDINLDHSTETDDAGNEYDNAALTIGFTCMGGAEFVTTVSIWKKLYEKAFESLKDFSLTETKVYMKPHVKECRDKAKEILGKLIGGAIKEAAQKALADMGEAWDSSKVKQKALTLLDKLGKHKTAIEGKITAHEINMRREIAKIEKRQAKLDKLILEATNALKEYKKNRKEYDVFKNLSDEDFADKMEEYFNTMQEIFGNKDVNGEILEAVKSNENREDAFKLIVAATRKAGKRYVKLKEQREEQREKLEKTLEESKEHHDKYSNYLEKEYVKSVTRAIEKSATIHDIIDEITSPDLSSSQKKKIENLIKDIIEIIGLLNKIMAHKEALLAEAKDNDNISVAFCNNLESSNTELQHGRIAIISHVQEIYVELSKLNF